MTRKDWKAWVKDLAKECIEHLENAGEVGFNLDCNSQRKSVYLEMRAELCAETARMICEDNVK